MLATDVAVASGGTCLASLGESSDGASDATAVASETAACGVRGVGACGGCTRRQQAAGAMVEQVRATGSRSLRLYLLRVAIGSAYRY